MNIRSIALLAAASILTIANQASAQVDFTPEAQRIISDPMYLPLAGQIYGNTGYVYSSAGRDVFDSTGAPTATGSVTGNTFTQELLYGVTDDIALRFAWGYVASRDASRHGIPTGFTENSSSGWTDPVFGATWRAIDQRDGGPLSLDLRVDYSPDAFPAKAPNADDEGTVARGGQAVNLGLTLGHETRDFTIAALFDAQYLDREKQLNQNTGDITHTDSRWNYTLGLATQTRITDLFSVNAGLGHTFSNDAFLINEATGIPHIQQPGDSTNINVSFNYHFVPNTVVGSIGYEHDFYGDSRNIYPTLPAAGNEIRNRSADVFGANLRYVFN
jgi:hypothetical protein